MRISFLLGLPNMENRSIITTSRNVHDFYAPLLNDYLVTIYYDVDFFPFFFKSVVILVEEGGFVGTWPF